MKMTLSVNVYGKPFTFIPSESTDAFRRLCQRRKIKIEVDVRSITNDGASEDVVTFPETTMELANEIVSEWIKLRRRGEAA